VSEPRSPSGRSEPGGAGLDGGALEVVPTKKGFLGVSRVDYDAIFREVATRIGGEVVMGGRHPEVHVSHGSGTVVLDIRVESNGQSTDTFTRVRAYFLANDNFSFRLTKRTFWSRFSWVWGMSEVSVGDGEFEEQFLLMTRHASRLRTFMNDRKLRELIRAHPIRCLEARGLSWWRRRKRGSRMRVLTLRTSGVVKEIGTLEGLIRVIQSGLDQLLRSGMAEGRTVDVNGHNGDLRRKL